MKKTLLSLFISATSIAAMAAETGVETTKDFKIEAAGTITPFVSGDFDYNIWFTSKTDGNARLGTISETNTPYTVNSMTLKAGDGTTSKTPSYWNALGNFTIQGSKADGEWKALINESTAYYTHQMGSFSIENTDDTSTATALIDMGKAYLQIQGNADSQHPVLNIKTNAKYTSSHERGLTLSNRARLKIADSKTLTVNSVLRSVAGDTSGTEVIHSEIKLGKSSTLTINNKTTLDNADITLDDNARFEAKNAVISATNNTITINSGAKFYSGDTMTIQDSTITNNGTFGVNVSGKNVFLNNTTVTGSGTYYAGNGATLIDQKSSMQLGTLTTGAGRMITVDGTLSVSSSVSFNNLDVSGSVTQTAGNTTTFNRIATFKADSSFSTTGDLIIKSGNATETHAAYTNVSLDAAMKSFVIKSNIEMWSGTLTLNKVNAIKTSSNDFVTLSVVSGDNYGNAKLDVNAANEFKSISADTKSLEIFLSNDPSATLKSSFEVSNGAKIILHDFVDNMVYVSNYETITNLSDVFTAYNTSDQIIEKLYCNNGWLSTTAAVPEPAEWAAIFGAIALGLAIYRRRK